MSLLSASIKFHPWLIYGRTDNESPILSNEITQVKVTSRKTTVYSPRYNNILPRIPVTNN